MFVSAPVIELHELNQKKKKKSSEIGYFQYLTPCLGIFKTCSYAFNLLEVLYTTD